MPWAYSEGQDYQVEVEKMHWLTFKSITLLSYICES